jgi:TPR repeat protein
MLRAFLGFIVALTAMAAGADVRHLGETNAVSMPWAEWELRFPSRDWMLVQQRSFGDGRQYYYMFTHLRTGMVASFYLEPAAKCDTGDACRAVFWKNPGPAYKNPKASRQLNAGEFSVVEFTTADGEPTAQRHWSAHAVRDGVWIDLHLSAITAQDKDYARFEEFAGSLDFAPKSACPECLKLKGLPRKDTAVLFAKARAGNREAWSRLLELARDGDADAQFMVARVYSWGAPEIKPDEAESVDWVTRAATQGHPEAQVNLAFFLATGRGGAKKDPEAAVAWWSKAAEQGYAPAQHSLGVYYDTDGKDPVKAFEWTKRAAEGGLAVSQLNLGAQYGRGAGTAQDLDAALVWYGKAAAQGNEHAMVNMAGMAAIAGKTNVESAEKALALLTHPLLATNRRAKEMKALICKEIPAACPQAVPTPTADPAAPATPAVSPAPTAPAAAPAK